MIIVESRFNTPAFCPLCKSIEQRGWYIAPSGGVLTIPYDFPPNKAKPLDQNRGPFVNVQQFGLHTFRIAWDQWVGEPKTQQPIDGKLLYLHGPKGKWDLIFAIGGMTADGIARMSISTNKHDYSDMHVPVFVDQVPVQYDAWHRYALDIRLNTPGNPDGAIALTVDGVTPPMHQGKNHTPRDLTQGCAIRGDNSPLVKVQWGMQVNRPALGTWDGSVHQIRHLRDVKIKVH